MENKSRFGRLLKEALSSKRINQKQLCEMLPGPDGKPISDSNISTWIKQGYAPEDRMAELIAILPGSGFAQAWADGGLRKPAPDLFATDLAVEKPPVMPSWKRFDENGLPPVRRFDSRLEDEVCEALPQALRSNWSGAVQAGAVTLRFDYVSERVVVELKLFSGGAAPPFIHRALLDLAIAQRLDGQGKRHYGLLLLSTTGSTYASGLYREQQRAGLLGIEIVAVSNAKEAANVIQQWEEGMPSEDFC